MNPYIPILIIIALSLGVGVIMTCFSRFLGPRNPTSYKNAAFECGVPQVTTRDRMSVKFYLTAIMFILFDIETVFLYLWAKVYPDLGLLGLAEIAIFMFILILGYVYVLKSGVLEWD